VLIGGHIKGVVLVVVGLLGAFLDLAFWEMNHFPALSVLVVHFKNTKTAAKSAHFDI
jgi:hypothetical protein